jgi:hypothetical protein
VQEAFMKFFRRKAAAPSSKNNRSGDQQ